MDKTLKQIARQTLPDSLRHWLKEQVRTYQYSPPLGKVNFGNLRRLTPISPDWGFDRGSPIDRYYVEQFLAANAKDIQGRVLEIEDNSYTCKFGGDRVTQSDVLHVKPGNPNATIVADLTSAEAEIPSDSFDCIVLTQTLQLIYELKAAVKTVHRTLKPGGVVLATVPGITQVSHHQPEQASDTWTHDTDNWSNCWCWNFTTLSAKKLFEEAFGAGNVVVESHGNVLAATAFLYGLAMQEFQPQELDYRDPDYQVIITVRAVKPETA
jgi:SAM-dependent methyltransferase